MRLLKKSKRIQKSMIEHHGFLFAKSLVYQTVFCFILGFFSFLLLTQYFTFSHHIIGELELIVLNLLVPKSIENQLFLQIKNAIQLSQKAEIFSVIVFLFYNF